MEEVETHPISKLSQIILKFTISTHLCLQMLYHSALVGLTLSSPRTGKAKSLSVFEVSESKPTIDITTSIKFKRQIKIESPSYGQRSPHLLWGIFTVKNMYMHTCVIFTYILHIQHIYFKIYLLSCSFVHSFSGTYPLKLDECIWSYLHGANSFLLTLWGHYWAD